MRVIKFRAWDKQHRKFTYPEIFGRSMPSNWESYYELQQFTGLLDRNGKEIYEGDVVKRISFLPPGGIEICQIVFTEGSFYSAEGYDEHEEEYIGYQLLTGDLEVIGNIHTTLELLTK